MADAPAGSGESKRLHKSVMDASNLYWDSKYEEAAKQLETKKETHPRYALEYAMLYLVKSFMTSTNENRDIPLDLFKKADGLATAQRAGKAQVSESETSEEEEEEDIAAATEDKAELDESQRAKLEKLKKAQGEKKTKKVKPTPPTSPTSPTTTTDLGAAWKVECDTIYADCILCRSILQLSSNSYLKGGVNLRKAWGDFYGLMQRMEKEPAAFPQDVQLNIKYGCGVFYCYLALVPAGLMKVLNTIGFISDRELGEQYLTEVYRSNSLRAGPAALVLCTYYLFLPTGLGNVDDTLTKAKAVIDTMNERYPENIYFHAYENFYHRKRGNAPEAVVSIQKATKYAKNIGVQPLLLNYLEADTLYMDLQWESAKKQYQGVLEEIKKSKVSFGYTGQVLISLAACFVMTGDNASAIANLKQVQSQYNSKSKNDANSPKYAARVLKEQRLLPLIGVYVLYINRDLAHMHAEHVARLRAELERVTDGKDLSPPEVSGFKTLFSGVMSKGMGDKEAALKDFEKILAVEKSFPSDSVVLPYTYYEFGELEYRRNELNHAKALFEKGSSLKGEGHETLSNRYNIALRQLKREMEARK